MPETDAVLALHPAEIDLFTIGLDVREVYDALNEILDEEPLPVEFRNQVFELNVFRRWAAVGVSIALWTPEPGHNVEAAVVEIFEEHDDLIDPLDNPGKEIISLVDRKVNFMLAGSHIRLNRLTCTRVACHM